VRANGGAARIRYAVGERVEQREVALLGRLRERKGREKRGFIAVSTKS